MNAAHQALTPELASKIAHLAVLFRAEFYDSQVDLSPWLMDEATQKQMDPYSIDLSFYFLRLHVGLACGCVLMQIQFSEDLLKPTCRLVAIEANSYHYGALQWQFSSASQEFSGKCLPDRECQARFNRLVNHMAQLFERPNQVNIRDR